MAAAGAGWGLLDPGPRPGLDLHLLQQLSPPSVFPTTPQTQLVLGSHGPGECEQQDRSGGSGWMDFMNRPQGLGWGLGQQRSQGGQGAPSSLSPSFFCSAVETFPTSCLSSLSLLWGPFPACLAHISAPLRPGCTEPGPLASPVSMVALRSSQECCPGSALHVVLVLVTFHFGLQLPHRNYLSLPITTPPLSRIPPLI